MQTPSRPELLTAFRRRVDEQIASQLETEHQQSEAMRAEVLEGLRRAVAEARAAGAKGRVWLFGSFAWGEPGGGSDVDLLVDGDEGLLVEHVARALSREVHALGLREAPETLRTRVLREGVEL